MPGEAPDASRAGQSARPGRIAHPDFVNADVIVVDGMPVRTSDELFAEVEVHPPGSKVTLSVTRVAKSVEVPVTLGGS